MSKLSLALATYNEESNIVDCIKSCKGLVDEIIMVDGSSTDKTVELAHQNGAKVIAGKNEHMFHINKQRAIDACSGEWILQLDADERVTPELASEIKKVISMNEEEIEKYQKDLKEKELFERHQRLVQRIVQSNVIPSEEGIQSKIYNTNNDNLSLDSPLRVQARLRGNDKQKLSTNHQPLATSYNAFFIPRLNFFLGGYLRFGGVYPDGVIRLFRKGKAYLPCKDVHELMTVEGKTGWLANPLIHKDSPTFKRYLERNSRYIDHLVQEIQVQNSNSNQSIFKKIRQGFNWAIIKPTITFLSLLIRHKGILDGWRGVVFAFFSAIRFARAYGRYIRS